MKTLFKTLLFLFFSLFSLSIFAQKPEPVYSIIRSTHDFEWYQQQAKAWKQEIDKGTKDKMAWVYFFKANRMARICDNKKWESLLNNYFLQPEIIIKLAEKAIPNSFEMYYLKAHDDSAGSESGSENILKAQKIKPYDPLLLSWLMNYYQFKNDKVNIELVSKKWLESEEMPEGLLTFTYNKLMSVDPNAILLVNGDNDTYPFWILQNVQKIRTDVLVLNISLTLIDSYRERIFKENNITSLSLKDSTRRMPIIIKHIIESVKDRPIYVSIQVDDENYKAYTDKMYLTGLVFKYSEKPFDNLAVLQNNVENKFLLDDLKIDFRNDYGRSVVNQSNLSYLAVFLKLHEHYLLCGENAKAKSIKELAKKVSENAGNNDWMKYFE
jgi:hypothetical protein